MEWPESFYKTPPRRARVRSPSLTPEEWTAEMMMDGIEYEPGDHQHTDERASQTDKRSQQTNMLPEIIVIPDGKGGTVAYPQYRASWVDASDEEDSSMPESP